MTCHMKTIYNYRNKNLSRLDSDLGETPTSASPTIFTILDKFSDSGTMELTFKPKVEVAASLFRPANWNNSSTLDSLLPLW